MNLQEAHELLINVISGSKLANELLLDTTYKDNEEGKEIIDLYLEIALPTAEKVVETLFQNYQQTFQFLAYLLCEHFDGEYVMSEGEMYAEFNSGSYTTSFIWDADQKFLKVVGTREEIK